MNLFSKIYNYYCFSKKPISATRRLGVKVGEGCRFISVSKATFGSEPFLISIGNHVTLTANVQFVTHDGGVWVFREEMPTIDVFGSIKLGNNIFIGYGAIILPGTIIEDNVVIGAGSVVKGLITANSVWAGAPIKKLMSIDQYKNKVLDKAEYIKSLPLAKRNTYLVERYKI